MAKPDWGVLQQWFLSEHAATGVSPKEWCEAQGLNYATARRYIKKPSAQTAQKPAQKDKSANELVDDDGLTAQQRLFVAEYLKDNNATQSAIRAGYSKKTAQEQSSRLLSNVKVAQAIAQQQKASIARTLGCADEVLAQMWQLATFDANQLSQYRRGACRYCWGFGHHYQWRDAVEFDEETAKVEGREGARLPQDTGGYGYDHNREPNPECPRCNGDGIGQPYFADTRKLSPDAALAYSGVKLGKSGVEITAISRERMYEAVMKRLGLADSEFAQRLQQIEIERRQLEVEKLRKELAGDGEDDEPTPVQININVVDARADNGDQPDT
ncbi:terminase small subunit [Enterobacter kobei]|nr:terminase small subunit [Enterobacter kobei]